MEAPEPDVMRRPPRDPDAPVFSRFVVVRTLLAGGMMAAGGIGLFLWEYQRELAAGVAPALALREGQTMAVTTVVLFQIFYLLNCRSLRDSLLAIGLFSNRHILAGIALLLALQAAFIYLPQMQAVFETKSLNGPDVLLAAAVAATILPVIGIEKRLRRRAG
jgi:Ca2+-transporting ATPase